MLREGEGETEELRKRRKRRKRRGTENKIKKKKFSNVWMQDTIGQMAKFVGLLVPRPTDS